MRLHYVRPHHLLDYQNEINTRLTRVTSGTSLNPVRCGEGEREAPCTTG